MPRNGPSGNRRHTRQRPVPDLPHIWFKDGWEQMTWVDPDAYIAWKHNGIGEPNSLDFHVSEWVNARWRARRQGNL